MYMNMCSYMHTCFLCCSLPACVCVFIHLHTCRYSLVLSWCCFVRALRFEVPCNEENLCYSLASILVGLQLWSVQSRCPEDMNLHAVRGDTSPDSWQNLAPPQVSLGSICASSKVSCCVTYRWYAVACSRRTKAQYLIFKASLRTQVPSTYEAPAPLQCMPNP